MNFLAAVEELEEGRVKDMAKVLGFGGVAR